MADTPHSMADETGAPGDAHMPESQQSGAGRRTLTEAQLRGAFRNFDPGRLPSPAFVVDKAAIQYNLDMLSAVAQASEAKILLALKGFSMFALADQISASLSGTTASGLYEARLGREEFGGEVHAYAPAFSRTDFARLLEIADHIVFNSFSQWEYHRGEGLAHRRYRRGDLRFGIRVNPRHSEGAVPLYDPCAPFSRMGTPLDQFRPELLEGISGLHFHTLCEQGAEPLERTLAAVEAQFGNYLDDMDWINLGGGHHITKSDYNRDLLIDLVRGLTGRHGGLEVYLEPGEAIAIHSGVLITSVMDLMKNGMDIAILNSSATCHMPDVLEMPYRPEIWGAGEPGKYEYLYRLGGQTCLSGDVIGDYSFPEPLRVGQNLIFDDMSHYTMVKTTTFNGIALPAICSFDSRSGEYRVIKEFGYEDFKHRLS